MRWTEDVPDTRPDPKPIYWDSMTRFQKILFWIELFTPTAAWIALGLTAVYSLREF